MSTVPLADTAQVVFTPSGKRGAIALGTSVLQAAQQLGVDLDSVCGGRGICGKCACEPGFGEFAKHQLHTDESHLSAPSASEQRYRAKRQLAPHLRLGCSTLIQGDMVIDVPAASQRHRQVIRKDAADIDIALNTAIRLYYLEVPEAELHTPSGDFQRVKQALARDWNIEHITAELPVLRALQQALQQGKNAVTVALWLPPAQWEKSWDKSKSSFEQSHHLQLVGIWPNFVETIYGAAIDLGSTTMSLHLCDLSSGRVVASSGMMNPQIRFGEDLMSRVSYAMMNSDGANKMTTAVREGLSTLLTQAAEQAEIPAELIMDVTIVGNPIMHHLVLGFDPIPLGGTPFALATNEAVHCDAEMLDLSINPFARVYLLPCIAGHVGADAAAMILAEKPFEEQDLTLLIDVGTNAEIVLGHRTRLLACSSPTGPALEGAQISCGQRAAAGAIERIRIDPHTFEPRYRVIGVEMWSDEDGFEQAVAGIGGVSGVCGSGIIEIIGELRLSGLMRADGVIDGRMAAHTPRIVPDERTFSYIICQAPVELRITQADVRAIQLAKAALYAGVKLLQDYLTPENCIKKIRLAGAFGSHIDTTYAMLLGLYPDIPIDQVTSAHNAAGTGARIALLNVEHRCLIETMVQRVEKIETAVEPAFQEHFIAAMSIPHAQEPFTHLWQALPQPKQHFDATTPEPASDNTTRRRQRRRRE